MANPSHVASQLTPHAPQPAAPAALSLHPGVTSAGIETESQGDISHTFRRKLRNLPERGMKMKINDSRALTPKLKDSSSETMETLRQADAFMRQAQDESLSVGQRQSYLAMANFRYEKVYVLVDEDSNVCER